MLCACGGRPARSYPPIVARVFYLLWRLAFPNSQRRPVASTVFRAAVLLFLVAWSVRYFRISIADLGEDPGWMHRVHLVFHEAGHAITGMVCNNHTVVVFMGSGLQVLFPLFVAVAFYWKNSDAFGAALGLWWTGHAALDVAPYIADARALELPLLGGGTGREIEGHDWEYLLTQWHALPHDTQIAAWVALAARVTMAVAFLWAAGAVVFDRFVLKDETGRGPSDEVES